MRPDDLTPLQISALTEIGSIGAGHAATALSQLVDHRIDLTVPVLDLMPVSDVPNVFGGPETLVAAVLFRLLGDIRGSILLVAGRDSCLEMVDLLRGVRGHSSVLGREEEAVFTNASSVLATAYLAAVGRTAEMNLLPSPPSFALDMAGAILESVTAEVNDEVSVALLIRARFHADESSVDAALLFIPDPQSLETILQRLGVAS